MLEVALGKKAVQLATVAPAKSPPGKVDIDNPHGEGLLPERPGHATAERLRAIKDRASNVVKDLFRADLIGITEASKLGPKNPSPAEAAKVTTRVTLPIRTTMVRMVYAPSSVRQPI